MIPSSVELLGRAAVRRAGGAERDVIGRPVLDDVASERPELRAELVTEVLRPVRRRELDRLVRWPFVAAVALATSS